MGGVRVMGVFDATVTSKADVVSMGSFGSSTLRLISSDIALLHRRNRRASAFSHFCIVRGLHVAPGI